MFDVRFSRLLRKYIRNAYGQFDIKLQILLQNQLLQYKFWPSMTHKCSMMCFQSANECFNFLTL